MRPPITRLVLAALVAATASPAVAAQKEKPRPAASREELHAVEANVARAVDRVSQPHPALLLGRPAAARAYRLPGYGIVLVLTPRTLPGGEGQVYVFGGPTHRRARTVVARTPAPTGQPADEEAIESFERQVVVLQEETEAARRAAEDETERILQGVRVWTTPQGEAHVEAATPPAPPEAPPAPEVVAAPPPWKFWFQADATAEKRTPEAVVADVRGALVDVLASGVRLTGMAADERVTVTVDFVPGGIFAASARPEKTLLVTARVRDVEARTRGAITPDDFEKRVEVTEY